MLKGNRISVRHNKSSSYPGFELAEYTVYYFLLKLLAQDFQNFISRVLQGQTYSCIHINKHFQRVFVFKFSVTRIGMLKVEGDHSWFI